LQSYFNTYSQKCRERTAANDFGFLEKKKSRNSSIILTPEMLEDRKVTI
jgi:hypothetical protein